MVVCKCGAPTVIRTSLTQSNPGRRFYCCDKRVSMCNFDLIEPCNSNIVKSKVILIITGKRTWMRLCLLGRAINFT
ncbi:putative transcription factor GRF family [Helianthus annuus]|nr:putative transcription factor GRF family [Helianthus annuus]